MTKVNTVMALDTSNQWVFYNCRVYDYTRMYLHIAGEMPQHYLPAKIVFRKPLNFKCYSLNLLPRIWPRRVYKNVIKSMKYLSFFYFFFGKNIDRLCYNFVIVSCITSAHILCERRKLWMQHQEKLRQF